jgi:hypothetical protein
MLVILLLAQASALVGLAAAIHHNWPMPAFVALAAAAGAPNGVVFSLYRYVLAQSTARAILLRRIATSLAVNEVVYISAPIAASFAGSSFPILSVLVMAASATTSALLATRRGGARPAGKRDTGSRPLRSVWIWLVCSYLASAAVAFVEVGAVELSVTLGWPTSSSGFIAAATCSTSGVAAAYVSWRIPVATQNSVFSLLATTLVGVILVNVMHIAWVVIAGCLLIGLGAAPLATFLSVLIQDAVTEHDMAAALAMLRAAPRARDSGHRVSRPGFGAQQRCSRR